MKVKVESADVCGLRQDIEGWPEDAMTASADRQARMRGRKIASSCSETRIWQITQ